MEYFKKIKISLKDYSTPVEAKSSFPKSLKTLKNIKKYDIHPDFKKILSHPNLEGADVDPSLLIVKSDNPCDIAIRVSRIEIIKKYDKIEVTEMGRVSKIDVDEKIVKKNNYKKNTTNILDKG